MPSLKKFVYTVLILMLLLIDNLFTEIKKWLIYLLEDFII